MAGKHLWGGLRRIKKGGFCEKNEKFSFFLKKIAFFAFFVFAV